MSTSGDWSTRDDIGTSSDLDARAPQDDAVGASAPDADAATDEDTAETYARMGVDSESGRSGTAGTTDTGASGSGRTDLADLDTAALAVGDPTGIDAGSQAGTSPGTDFGGTDIGSGIGTESGLDAGIDPAGLGGRGMGTSDEDSRHGDQETGGADGSRGDPSP